MLPSDGRPHRLVRAPDDLDEPRLVFEGDRDGEWAREGAGRVRQLLLIASIPQPVDARVAAIRQTLQHTLPGREKDGFHGCAELMRERVDARNDCRVEWMREASDVAADRL